MSIFTPNTPVTKPVSRPDRRYQWLNADDVHHPGQIVGEHVQSHFSCDVLEALHQEV